jgi:PST family polysaccharide transporter
MLSFSVWSLIEAISIWFTMWVDAFIIGSTLNGYYLGLYKTSTTMVNTLMALITASAIPVLFSVLSRLQNDSKQFNRMYFKIQRLVSIFVFPMGVGVFLYSDLATQILLGSQWSEASGVIGVWSLTSAITIVFGYFCSEVYRAKGKPKLSFLSQVLHLVVLVPVCIISSKYGFWPLVYARSWIRMQGVLVGFIIMKFAMGIPMFKTLGNVFPTAISAAGMGLFGFYLRQLYDGVVWSFASIIICIAVYFGLLYIFPNIRKEMTGIVKRRFI